jgi:hypothetical protein
MADQRSEPDDRATGPEDASERDLEKAHALADPGRDAGAEGHSTGDQIGGKSSHGEDEIEAAGGGSSHPDSGRPNISDTNDGWGVAEKDKMKLDGK